MVGREKQFFLLTSKKSLTMVRLATAPRIWSWALLQLCTNCFHICFSSSILTQWLQKVGARGMENWVDFLYYYFPPPNGTPTPYFIGYKRLGIWLSDRLWEIKWLRQFTRKSVFCLQLSIFCDFVGICGL